MKLVAFLYINLDIKKCAVSIDWIVPFYICSVTNILDVFISFGVNMWLQSLIFLLIFQLKVYQVLPPTKTKKKRRRKLLETRRVSVHSTGWEIFSVKEAVADWIKNNEVNLGKKGFVYLFVPSSPCHTTYLPKQNTHLKQGRNYHRHCPRASSLGRGAEGLGLEGKKYRDFIFYLKI